MSDAVSAFFASKNISPLGYRKSGQPIWPICGGSGEGEVGDGQGGNEGGDGFKAITSQADLDKIIGDRVTRERAKFADYKDLKTKAAEYDKLAEANKSEVEKANDRATAAEAEVATLPTKVSDALRTHLVALHEIDKDDAELFLTANDPELLLKQVSRLLEQGGRQKQRRNHAPREGTNDNAGQGDGMREFTRNLFRSAADD